jgi:class 3 adenylate cyclase
LGNVEGDYTTPGFAVALARSVGSDWLPDNPNIVFRIPPDNGDSAFPVYELRPELLTVYPPREWLADKIVLVGAVRPYEDRHRTPLVAALGPRRGTVSGVVLHAHVLAQLLDRRSAEVPAPFWGWFLTLLMGVVGVLIATRMTHLWLTILLGVGVLLGYCGMAIAGPRLVIPSIPILAPSFAFLVTSLATGTWIGYQERRRRRFLKRAFSRYVSPAVVEAVCAEPDRLTLGGERRELSFVFTDVEGYTTLSESLDPELLGELFNDYLNQVVALIFEHGGTLEKFVGDAVMTMFGAPLEQPDHACRALDFALAVDRWSRQFESTQRERGIAFGRTRIGVNSGVATVGNFGGTLQFSYTAHGDAVNTAARLETLNKHLGTRICVGERTRQLCTESPLRPVGDLVLKGKTEALQVFEPIQKDEPGRADQQMYLRAYRNLARNDPVAAEAFAGLRRDFPKDPLVRYHWERMQKNYKGVRIVMETK